MLSVLVNHLGGRGQPRNSVGRLTDGPDMIIAVYHGYETTEQNNRAQLFKASLA